MQPSVCAANVERASEALQAFVSRDEGKALEMLCDDLQMKDPVGLFAGDTMRLRRFLVHMASDARRCFHMAPWSYAGTMLRFRVGFQAGSLFRNTAAKSGTSMSIWVDLSQDGRIRELDIRYRPETIISALSKGVADRFFRLLLYKVGFLRFISPLDVP